MDHSELHVLYPNPDQALSLPSAVAWMTGTWDTFTLHVDIDHWKAPGVYHGNLNHDSNSDDLIDGAQLLPYPAIPSSPSMSSNQAVAVPSNVPMSMVFTDFHFVLLYRDRVIAVSTLNEEVTYEDILPLVCITAVVAWPHCSLKCRNRTSKYKALPRILYERHIGYIPTSLSWSWNTRTRIGIYGRFTSRKVDSMLPFSMRR